MIRVVCLNWRNYLGRGDEYVEKLRNMVARHLSLPHTFEVVTEKDVSGAGWWAKLEILGMFSGPTLYLDLDEVITGSLDPIVTDRDPDKLWMRDDFSYSIVNPRKDIGPDMHQTLAGPGTCNSSVMYWCQPFHVERKWPGAHGDQNVITAALWPDKIGLLPNDQILSYKYHWRMKGELGPIMVFHGNPKPHEVGDDWVRQHWN